MIKDIPDVQFATSAATHIIWTRWIQFARLTIFQLFFFSRLCLRGLHGSHRLFAFEPGHGTWYGVQHGRGRAAVLGESSTERTSRPRRPRCILSISGLRQSQMQEQGRIVNVAFFEQTENIKEKLTVDPGLAIKIIDNGELITLYVHYDNLWWLI